MSWQLLIGLSVLVNSISVLLQRFILGAGKVTPGAFSVFVGLMCGGLLALIAAVQGKLSFVGVVESWPNILLATLTYAAGGLITNIALKKTEASKFTVLFATRGLITIVIAAVLLNESVSLLRGLGAVLIFLGVAVTSWQAKQLRLQEGDWLSLIGAVIFGIANVNDRFALQRMELYPYLILAYVLPALVIAMVLPKSVSDMRVIFQPQQFASLLILTVFFLLSGLTFFAALQIAPNTAQVAAINLTSVVTIVALSVIFLKETAHWQQKLIGACITLVGLWLLG